MTDVVKTGHDTTHCAGCDTVPPEVILDLRFVTIRLCWTCAMAVRNGIERERLQKHERLDEMERLEAEYGL